MSKRPTLQVRQVASACAFCKLRKIKCDGAAPACSGCIKHGRSSTCSLFNSSTGQHGIDYPTYLQGRVRCLQDQLGGLKTAQHSSEADLSGDSRPSASTHELGIDSLVADIAALPILASSYPTSSTGPTLSTIVLAAASKRSLETVNVLLLGATPSFLPKYDTAVKLVEHYIGEVYPRLPFFPLRGLWRQFSQVYPEAGTLSAGADVSTQNDHNVELNSNYSHFTILLVLAISTSSVSRNTGSVASRQARRLVDEALRFRDSAVLPNSMIGVQSLLFLIQYAALNPSILDVWYLIGVAMRNCINLGLHQDPQPLHSVSASLLETRRRLWWSTYSFDRSVSVGLGRPTEISDEMIGAQLPTFQIESTATSIQIQGYLQRYRALQLQSRIYDALGRQCDSSCAPDVVVNGLAVKLSQWRQANSEEHSLTLVESEWLLGNMLLYRPCRLIPERSLQHLRELWTAATGFIALYRQLVEINSIFYSEIACEKAYWTGLAILYSFWKLSSTVDLDSPGNLRSVDLWLSINHVLYVLRNLSERWEDGKLLTSEFETISSRTVQLMETRSPGSDLTSELSWQVLDFGNHSTLTKYWTSGEGGSATADVSFGRKPGLEDLISEI